MPELGRAAVSGLGAGRREFTNGFRLFVFDYEDSLFGSYAVELATVIPVFKVAKLAKLNKVADAARGGAAEEGGLVIGKMDDLGRATGWRSGDHMLHLPKLPPGPGRWAQNERELLNAMSTGRPNRDISPTQGGGFLDRERNLLIESGWRFDPKTSFWSPGQ